MAKKIPVEDKLSDIQRVATELGEAPTVSEYRDHGEYSIPTVAKGFDGSFVKAREAAGVCEGEVRPNSREDLLSDIERVADVVDREPSKNDYKEHGEYALSGITYRFESWIEAKKEAGVYESGLGHAKEVSRQRIVEDMKRVANEIGEPLSHSDYNEHGRYHSKTVLRYIGPWKDACSGIGIDAPNHGTKYASDELIIEDIQAVRQDIQHYPSKSEYNEHGRYSEGIAKYRFGTWMNALERAGFEGNPQDGARNPNWKDEAKYDNYIHPKWKENRPKALERDEYECQDPDCDLTRERHLERFGVDLSVHHIRRNHWPDEPAKHHSIENLITLCKLHHQKYEILPAKECEKLKES